jgi:hypothetical protein
MRKPKSRSALSIFSLTSSPLTLRRLGSTAAVLCLLVFCCATLPAAEVPIDRGPHLHCATTTNFAPQSPSWTTAFGMEVIGAITMALCLLAYDGGLDLGRAGLSIGRSRRAA